MSRSSSVAASQTPSLLEELEKLEQSITLTLQEIDSNFSRAHRIVTTSIIPVVQEYAKHSETVWEGSKFWKQFFEASANVSLSGYEETPPEDSFAPEDSTTTQTSSAYDSKVDEDTVTGSSVTPPRPSSAHTDDEEEGLSTELLSSPSIAHAHSTPRQPHASKSKVEAATPSAEDGPSFADYGSPYESLKREITARGAQQSLPSSPIGNPMTPSAKQQVLPDTSMSPQSSPFDIPTTSVVPTSRQRPTNNDPLLHQILDKTYRIAATPHSTRKAQLKPKAKAHKPSTGFTPSTRGRQYNSALDSSPLDSSPEMAAPQLRADIFSSPMKAHRTPGVSIMASARKTPFRSAIRDTKVGAGANLFAKQNTITWDSDEELEDDLDFSPPKTMQFHVPQSRLLQTPAREASKRIVEDLLLTAGGDITDDFDQADESPSVVRRHVELDDTF